ncbi:MAG: hypothetical protein ACRC6V_17015 [Bacteroidales bacterium]
MPNPSMHKMAYPIETEAAYKFWGSRHVCNRVKAIISFSTDIEDALLNLRRHGFTSYHFRKRATDTWGSWVARPDMDTIPFTPLGVDWWDCLSGEPAPGPNGRWALWMDEVDWTDTEKWIEWIPDQNP